MEVSSLKPAIFFDRDGTLIEDRGYLRSPPDVVFHEDTLSALKRLKSHYLLFIVTNQPGIGFGILSYEEVENVNRYVVSTLAQAGITVSAVYYCPHARDQGCDCIKPKPYFLLKAAEEFNVDLSRSFVIGDHPHDVEFARSVGAKGIYLLTGHGRKHRNELSSEVFVAESMEEATTLILKKDFQLQNGMEVIRHAAEVIRKGGLVAFPTETVYGLGADAFNPLAVARIFEVKKRPYFDPLIVHVANHGELGKLVTGIPIHARRLMERFWPGPLTIVLLKKEDVPDIVTAGLPTVAVRMPRHRMALRLIEQADCPIAAPSANPFGYLSPTTAEHVRDQLGGEVDLILDGGRCEVGVESTILSFAGGRPRLLRPGGVEVEEIESLIGKLEAKPGESRPLAPGMFPKHYSPRTPIVIDWGEEGLNTIKGKRIGWLGLRDAKGSSTFDHREVLSKNGNLREAAANLFSAIRRLDSLNLDLILAEAVPEVGLGRAIMDRLRRASQREWPMNEKNEKV